MSPIQLPSGAQRREELERLWDRTYTFTGGGNIETIANVLSIRMNVLAALEVKDAVEDFKVSSDASARRIEALTEQLVRLTIALLALTVVLGLIAAPPAIETVRAWLGR